MIKDRMFRSELINKNLARIVEDSKEMQDLVSRIDMNLSLGHIEQASEFLDQYQCLLGQADSDTAALLNLICTDE